MNLNYSSLAQLPKIPNFGRIILVAAVAIIGGSLLLSPFDPEIASFIPVATMLGGLLVFISYFSKVRGVRKQILQQFAADNKFVFSPMVNITAQSGTIFQHGSLREGKNGIEGEYNHLPFKLFDYEYTTGSGKNRRTHSLSVLSFTLPRVLPHMVIDSLVEPGTNGTSVLPIMFDRSQRIKLEGDFNRYFDLYAPDTYSISALTILAPDVMMTLMQHAALCDIEIIDDKLYFYWPIVADESSEFEKIFTTAQEVLEEIQTKLTSSDIYATDSQAKIHTQEDSRNGVRLKPSSQLPITIGIFLFVGFMIAVQLFPEQLALFYIVGTWALVIGVFIGVYIRATLRQRKLRELEKRYSITPRSTSGNK